MGAVLEIEKIAGVGGEGVFCGIYNKRITLFDSASGNFIACVLLKNGDRGRLQEAAAEIFETASRKLEDFEGLVLSGIESCSGAIVEYLSGEDIEADFVLALFHKDAVYLVRFGEKVRVFAYEGAKSGEIGIKSGSGPVKVGQIFLFVTEDFLDEIDLSRLKEEVDLGELVDELATKINSREDQSRLGAAFVKVKEVEGGEGIEDTGAVRENEEVERDKGLVAVEERRIGDVAESRESVFKKLRGGFAGVLRNVGKELVLIKRGEVGAILRLRKNIIVVVVLVLLVLGGSVGFALRQNEQSKRGAEFKAHFDEAMLQFDRGEAVMGLNSSRAREILAQAKKEIELALETKPDNEEARELSEKIASKLKETEQTEDVKLNQVVEIQDENLISLAIFGDKLMAFSAGGLFEIDKNDGQSAKRISKAEGVISGFVFDNRGFALSENGIVSVDLRTGKSQELIGAAQGQDMAVFLGNIYVLGEKEIDKYVPVEGGYAQATAYLEESVDFSGNSQMAIDGAIWVSAGKQIHKFIRGEKQDFKISGLASELGELGAIYTNADLNYVYVVDRVNLALLVIDKEGVYQKAYQSGEFGKVSDVVVDEAGNKMYLAVDSKVLEADL